MFGAQRNEELAVLELGHNFWLCALKGIVFHQELLLLQQGLFLLASDHRDGQSQWIGLRSPERHILIEDLNFVRLCEVLVVARQDVKVARLADKSFDGH